MATVAQGITAGNLANGLTGLSQFVQALQAAVAAGVTVQRISIVTSDPLAPATFTPANPLTVADSAALMNALISLAGGLSTEWTNQLTAL
jgi:hypothetical protein